MLQTYFRRRKGKRGSPMLPWRLAPLLIAVLLLAAALAACGGDGSPGDTAGDATPRPTAAGDDATVPRPPRSRPQPPNRRPNPPAGES